MQVIATVMIAVTEKCRNDIREKIEQIMRKAGAKEEWAILSGVKTTYYQFTGNQNDPLIKMYFELSRRRYRGVGCWGISYYPQYTPEERKQTAGYWLQGGIICYVTDR